MVGRSLLLALAACIGAVLADPGSAHAQISGSSSGGLGVAAGSESITSPIPNPNRFLFQSGKYVDVTNYPRPQNLNPTGVNFSDCEQDLRLDFPLVISGFNPGDYAHIEVWAGTVDCTQDANRNNINAGVSQPCWRVHGDLPPQNAVSAYSMPALSIYVRDVLRFEQPIMMSGQNISYDGNYHDSANGKNACFVQTSDAGVQLSVYFIPIGPNHQAMGTAYQYPLNTDLVAPPPPYNVTLNAGDSLLQVKWTSPGNDPDIVGYAVFSDPPAAGATSGGCSCGSSLGNGANSYVPGAFGLPNGDASCTDAEADAIDEGEAATAEAAAMDVATESAVGEAGGEAGMVGPEASVPEASSESGAADAGPTGGGAGTGNCSSGGITVGVEGGACYSSALESHVFTVNGGGSTPILPTDDSGTSSGSVGAEGGVSLAGGGISSIDPKYEVGEIDDFTATQLTLTGLTNGDSYTVVVTSIDGSGNVGPVSTPACGTPQPTNDYWKTYKKDNGGALGCALESGTSNDVPLFALGLAATAAAFIRRRTRR